MISPPSCTACFRLPPKSAAAFYGCPRRLMEAARRISGAPPDFLRSANPPSVHRRNLPSSILRPVAPLTPMGERWKMAESAPDMRRVERGGEWGNFWPNRTMQERVGRDIASVSWRQVLVSPADIRGHPRHVRTEGGRWKMRNYKSNQRKSGDSRHPV